MRPAVRCFLTTCSASVFISHLSTVLLSCRLLACLNFRVCANNLFIIDPIPSPAVLAQLTARICRMGQTKRCYIYNMVVANTIEERLIQLRQKFAAEAGSGGSASSSSSSLSPDNLSPKEILWLLEQE